MTDTRRLAGNGVELVRERALAMRVQAGLERVYRLDRVADVGDFLHGAEAGEREALLVREVADGDLEVTLRLPQLEEGDANLDALCQIIEGVSHFVYVAWNTGHDKPVTLLELELQAEVDKYVLGAWLLREQGQGRFPRELHRALFERAHVDPVAAAGRVGLYQMASTYAARFCRRVAATLERRRFGVTRDLMAELRRFYRWGNLRKLRHIERYA